MNKNKEMVRKRQRAPNFSPDEKIDILNIIAKYKDIIENKRTDAATWAEKADAWRKVEEEFNARNTVHRSKETLKTFFENQKRQGYKKAAVNTVNGSVYGVVPPRIGAVSNISDDPLFIPSLDVLNGKSVYGLESEFDGNAITRTLEDFESPHEENGLEHEFEVVETKPEIQFGNTNCDDDDKAAPNLLLSDRLTTPSNSAAASRKPIKNNTRESWMNRRRSGLTVSRTVAKSHEELTNLKIKIANVQLDVLNEEKRKMETVRKKEEELYNLKIRKEQLDIQIKEMQLKLLLKHNNAEQ